MKLEDKVLERIDYLGGKLDNVSQHAWEALVKYQIIYGVVDLVVGIVVIALTIFLWKVLISQLKKAKEDEYTPSLLFEYRDNLSIIGIVYVIVAFLLTIFALAYLVYGIPMDILRISNPEIFAVKNLIEQAKGGS
ncbi:membrane protein [Staphylococcus phage vB-SscS-F1]|nr:membrane protein [Arcanobacterium phage vB-ApyS-JF1]